MATLADGVGRIKAQTHPHEARPLPRRAPPVAPQEQDKNMQRVPMTPRGKRLLEERLHILRSVERPQNVADIETARAHGDLSENAEYKFAKHRQGEIEGQIRYCESRLSLAQVIDPASLRGDKVVFGATVTFSDLDQGGKEETYQIVGEDEADIKSRLVSVTSPLAQGLIGKEEGDTVNVTTPKGIRKLEIVSVEFVNHPPKLDDGGDD